VQAVRTAGRGCRRKRSVACSGLWRAAVPDER
jgi:hypothetical protein